MPFPNSQVDESDVLPQCGLLCLEFQSGAWERGQGESIKVRSYKLWAQVHIALVPKVRPQDHSISNMLSEKQSCTPPTPPTHTYGAGNSLGGPVSLCCNEDESENHCQGGVRKSANTHLIRETNHFCKLVCLSLHFLRVIMQ